MGTTRQLDPLFRERSNEPVVVGVTANPVPNDAISAHDRQSTVVQTDASRIDCILAFELLKVQAGVRRIALKEPVCALRIALDVNGELRK
jgi:hypothetical protein